MITEKQHSTLEYCFNLSWNIIPVRVEDNVKKPAVPDYKEYFDSKKTFTLDELLYYANRQYEPYFGVVLGLQRDNRLLIGIDFDTKDERLFKAITQSIYYSTLYQETRRGYHLFYYVDYKDYGYDKLIEKIEDLEIDGKKGLGIELYTQKRMIVFLGNNYGELQGEITTLTVKEFIDNAIALEHATKLCEILNDYYMNGNRNNIIFYLSGLLARKRIAEKIANAIVDFICTYFNDEQKKDRLKEVKRAYDRYRKGEPLDTRLEKVLPVSVAEKVYKCLDYNPNGNKKDKEENKTTLKLKSKSKLKLDSKFIITEEYKEPYIILDLANKYAEASPYIQALYLLKFYKDNDTNAKFIDDYRFVFDKNHDEGGYWIEWNGYCWRDANIKVLKLKIDKFFSNKIKFINELYDELVNDLEDIQNSKHKALLERLLNKNEEKEVKNEEEEEIDVEGEDAYRKEKINLIRELLIKERDYVISLLSRVNKSENAIDELLACITKTHEYYEEGLLIPNELLNPKHIKVDTSDIYDNRETIYINTKTHLLVWKDSIKDFIALKHDERTKRLYITRYADVEYDQEAECPLFINFLKEITLNNIDLARFLAIIGGLTLVNRQEEIAFIFTGAGYNGKSTLVQVFLGIAGEAGYDAKVELLEEVGTDLTPNLYRCIGKILVVIDDPRVKMIDTSALKSLVSTGKMNVRTLWRRPVDIDRDFNIIICVNEKPKLTEHNEGMYRRIIYIPFKYKVPREKAILDYHKVMLEKERSGIFNLFVAGLKEYLSNLPEKKLIDIAPEVVKAETEKQIWIQDHVKEFIDRFLNIEIDRENKKIAVSELYDAYIRFCQMKNIPEEIILSKQLLSFVLEERYGIESKLIKKVTYKLGISWKDPPRIDDIITDDNKNGERKENEKEKEDNVVENNDNDKDKYKDKDITDSTVDKTAEKKSDNNRNKRRGLKIGRIFIHNRYITDVIRDDTVLICKHCNVAYTDTYKLAEHLKRLSGVDISKMEIKEVGTGSMLTDYLA